MTAFSESVVEDAALAWLEAIGWRIAHGPDIAPDMPAFQQLQTCKAEVPALFAANAVLVVLDGVEARAGTLTASREWFKSLRTISGEALADGHRPYIAPDGLAPERADFAELVFAQRLHDRLVHTLISGELRIEDAEKFMENAL